MVVAKSVNLVSCWTVLVNLVVVCCGSKTNHGHGGSKQLHPLPGTATDVVTPWIQSFCRQAGCEFYSEIPSSFIKDPVTTATVCDSLDSPYVDAAIRLINGDTIPPNTPFASSSSQHPSKREAHEINAVAEHLYDLLHARYVITYEGLRSVRLKYEQGDPNPNPNPNPNLQSVRLKYEQGVYGQCPRVYCRGHPLLPVGLHDRTKQSTVKCFCPKCRDIYTPPSVRHRKIDGAAFGTTLPHLLLQRMPELCPVQPKDRYVPRIFGFELHETSTELQIYQGITTTGYDGSNDDSTSNGQKVEEKRDLMREMDILNEMEEEGVEEDEEEEEEEEGEEDDEGVDEKGESEDNMDLSELDEND